MGFRENYEKFLRKDFLNACFRAKTPKKYLKYISVRALLRSLRAVAQKLRILDRTEKQEKTEKFTSIKFSWGGRQKGQSGARNI